MMEPQDLDLEGGFGPPPGHASTPGWMITFADLMSLLVSFFVLLFATTSIHRGDWERVVQPISTYLAGHSLKSAGASVSRPPQRPRLDLGYAEALVRKRIADDPALAGCLFKREDRDLLVTLPTADVAHWVGGSEPALGGLVRLLINFDNRLTVTVHHSLADTALAESKTDWLAALDAARAMAEGFARLGYAKSVDAVGLADLTGGAARIEIRIDDAVSENPAAENPATEDPALQNPALQNQGGATKAGTSPTDIKGAGTGGVGAVHAP